MTFLITEIHLTQAHITPCFIKQKRKTQKQKNSKCVLQPLVWAHFTDLLSVQTVFHYLEGGFQTLRHSLWDMFTLFPDIQILWDSTLVSSVKPLCPGFRPESFLKLRSRDCQRTKPITFPYNVPSAGQTINVSALSCHCRLRPPLQLRATAMTWQPIKTFVRFLRLTHRGQ